MGSARVIVAGLAIVAGCGRVGFALLGDATGSSAPGDAGITCQTPTLATNADEGAEHQDAGLPITWAVNPPTSGTHYPDWVVWNQVYDTTPIDRGYWVHNLEHGGIVYLYHCEPACPDEVLQLRDLVAALPSETDCPMLVHRAIVVEDKLLPDGVRFAATAWLHSWTSNCVDASALSAFYSAHLNQGPELNCAQGTYP